MPPVHRTCATAQSTENLGRRSSKRATASATAATAQKRGEGCIGVLDLPRWFLPVLPVVGFLFWHQQPGGH